jgi:hypothetical protein
MKATVTCFLKVIRFNLALVCTVTKVTSTIEHGTRIVISRGKKVIASGNGRLRGHRITATLRAHGKLGGSLTITLSAPGWHTVPVVRARRR